MSTVFIGGSRRLSRLNDDVRVRLDNIIRNGLAVLIGDANGADKAVQQYLVSKGYRNVTIYCVEGRCRNNLGGWVTKPIEVDRARKDFEYYAAKDRAMAKLASCGFMIWDGKSRGTLNNIANLLRGGKSVAVYFGPEQSSHTLRSLEDLEAFLDKCPEPDRRRFARDLATEGVVGDVAAHRDLFVSRRG
ncbi:MAG: hypothetical protein ACREQ9_17090 [Candidatus Binatia bacterium]